MTEDQWLGAKLLTVVWAVFAFSWWCFMGDHNKGSRMRYRKHKWKVGGLLDSATAPGKEALLVCIRCGRMTIEGCRDSIDCPLPSLWRRITNKLKGRK